MTPNTGADGEDHRTAPRLSLSFGNGKPEIRKSRKARRSGVGAEAIEIGGPWRTVRPGARPRSR